MTRRIAVIGVRPQRWPSIEANGGRRITPPASRLRTNIGRSATDITTASIQRTGGAEQKEPVKATGTTPFHVVERGESAENDGCRDDFHENSLRVRHCIWQVCIALTVVLTSSLSLCGSPGSFR